MHVEVKSANGITIEPIETRLLAKQNRNFGQGTLTLRQHWKLSSSSLF